MVHRSAPPKVVLSVDHSSVVHVHIETLVDYWLELVILGYTLEAVHFNRAVFLKVLHYSLLFHCINKVILVNNRLYLNRTIAVAKKVLIVSNPLEVFKK